MNDTQQINIQEIQKKLADSIYNAILSGADFSALAMQFSNDEGSKIKGGDLGTFGYGAMVPEFNDFCFNKSTGSKGVVKTQFGYHIIDLISQKDVKPAYKIAYVAKEVIASQETINKASLDAIRASSEKNKDALQKYISKNGLSLTTNPSLVKENDYAVGALQDARSLVRWAFEAAVGDVSEPFSIGDQFVIATLDKINKKGVQDVATARPGCEVIIRNKKKAAIISKKLGTSPTLETAAAAYNKAVQYVGADSTITFSSQMINGIGVEAKVLGAAFSKSLKGKISTPIEGNSGVYIVKVMDIQSRPAPTNEMMPKLMNTKVATIRSQSSGWYEGLKNQADIKDERSKHY
jgi:peptidyl-prolyl cis-trans isomerase D